jgi:hypothetical protein
VRIPQLQVQTTKAELGLTIQQPQQHIKQKQADVQIEQPAAELSIRTTQGQLHIDSSQARSELGLKTMIELARNDAQKGVQGVMAGIARRAREGDILMSIEKGGNAISSIIDSRTIPQPKALGIKFIPSANSVKMSYTPASVDIQVQKNDPKIDVNINKPIHDYTPGKVIVDLQQKPSIEIDWKV